MRSRWTRIVLAIAGATLLLGASGFAQSGSTDEGKRKVKSKVTRAIGGHPLLVQACQDAVKEWKFMAAPEESTQVVEFDFTGAGAS